jgi:heptosyltransferase III
MRRLAIRPGGIGDFILSLPALECLQAEYLEIWTQERNAPLAGFADRARSIASTGLDLLGVTDPPATLIEELRGFDSIVSWYGANRAEFREAVEALGLPITFFPALPPSAARMHAADFYLAQARTMGDCASDGIPRIRWKRGGPPVCLDLAFEAQDQGRPRTPAGSESERQDQGRPEACPTGYAVIHPFSGSRRKDWPLEKYRALAARLERVMPVRWCSGPEDPQLAGAVRIDDLYELARWLAGARLYIGNDSGITHLAAAAGAPVLALFGPTDPAVWAPRGPNVRVARWTPG